MVQPSLQPPGGGNGVAAWMLQSLKGQCELTVLTWAPVDLEEVNRFYGTTLTPADATAVRTAPLASMVTAPLPFSLAFLKRAVLLRAARAMAEALRRADDLQQRG